MTDSILRVKDVVCLRMDTLGVLAVPNFEEPVPEAGEKVTHLRVLPFGTFFEDVDLSRCHFRIEIDFSQKQELVFGSVIKLTHVPSELTLVGRKHTDDGFIDEVSDAHDDQARLGKPHMVALSHSLHGESEQAHRWIVLPRYKLRQEAEPVRDRDYVILRNAEYKDLVLTSFASPSMYDKGSRRFVGFAAMDHISTVSKFKVGVRLCRISTGKVEDKSGPKLDTDAVTDEKKDFIQAGDYLRIEHKQYEGHIICRVDDEEAMKSRAAPLGTICAKQISEKDLSHCIFARSFAAQKATELYDFSTSYSGLGLWQVICKAGNNKYNQQKISFNDRVRFRHVISGQFLCMRPVRNDDCAANKQHSLLVDKPVSRRVDGEEQDLTALQEGFAAIHAHVDADVDTPGDHADENITEEAVQVTVQSVEIRGLVLSDWLLGHDVYVHCNYGHQMDIKSNPRRPKNGVASWELNVTKTSSTFIIGVQDIRAEPLHLSLFMKNKFRADKEIGIALPNIMYSHSDEKIRLKSIAGQLCDEHGHDVCEYTVNLQVESIQRKLHLFTDEEIEEKAKAVEIRRQALLSSKNAEDVAAAAAAAKLLMLEEHQQLKLKSEAVTWTFATVTEESELCDFSLADINRSSGDDALVAYGDNILLLHYKSQLMIKLIDQIKVETSDGLSSHASFVKEAAAASIDSRWWEYKEDRSLVPAKVTAASILDQDVCAFIRVNPEEIQDAWFASRLPLLAQTATTVMQLTPSADKLFSPTLRHFKNALSTYSLWMMAHIPHDGELLDETKDPKGKHQALMSHTIDQVKSDDIDDELVDPTDVEVKDDEAPTPMTPVLTPHSRQKSNNLKMHSMRDLTVSMYDINAEDDDIRTPNFPHSNERLTGDKLPWVSALSPWIGRKVQSGLRLSSRRSTLDIKAAEIASAFVSSHTEVNAMIIRRQFLLSESRLIEQLLQFLYVVFVLERRISADKTTHGQSHAEAEEYTSIDPLIYQCCEAIQVFFHVLIHHNAKNALKMIAVHGSFMFILSQHILGWNTPIDTILSLACAGAKAHDESLSILEQDGRIGLSDFEDTLIKAITPNDLRQIVEQMHELHLSYHPTSLKLLNLMEMLCSSAGKASQQFQKVLAQYLLPKRREENEDATSEESKEVFLESKDDLDENEMKQDDDEAERRRQKDKQVLPPFSCLLFDLRQDLNGRWLVMFRSSASVADSALGVADMNVLLRTKLLEEAQGIFNVFNTYDSAESGVDDNSLALQECFMLLVDLGFGGPSLYEEIGHLAGCGFWGFLQWFSYRVSFFYPSAATGHLQLSPYEIMQLLNKEILLSEIKREMGRTHIDRFTVQAIIPFERMVAAKFPFYQLEFASIHDDEIDIMSTAVTDGRAISPLAESDFKLAPKKYRRYANKTMSMMEVEFASAMSQYNHDSAWFRQALKLMVGLCSHGDSLVQHILSAFLPADCLVDALSSGRLLPIDRCIVCDLLRKLYVQNDFVYSSTFSTSLHTLPICGADESYQTGERTEGKLFNHRSCVPYLGKVSNDSLLRLRLFDWLNHETASLDLLPTKIDDIDVLKSTEAFLVLMQELLMKGFFDDPSFRFFELTQQKVMSSSNSDSNSGYTLSGKKLDSSPFQTLNLHKIFQLMCKLLADVIDEHQTGGVMVDDQEIHGDDMLPTHSPPLMTARRVFSSSGDEDNPASSPDQHHSPQPSSASNKLALLSNQLSALSLGAFREEKRSIDEVLSCFEQFNEMFSNSVCSSILREAVSLLKILRLMKQRVRMQIVWSAFNQLSVDFAKRLESEDLSLSSTVITDNDRLLQLLRFSNKETKAYSRAVIVSTLSNDNNMLKEAFDELVDAACPERSFEMLWNRLMFCESPKESFRVRATCSRLELLCVYVTDVFSLKEFCRDDFIFLIKAIIHRTLEILYDEDGEADPESLGHILLQSTRNYAEYINTTIVGIGSNKKKANSAKNRALNHMHKALSHRIPCPAGEDDFFDLDVRKIMDNTQPQQRSALNDKLRIIKKTVSVKPFVDMSANFHHALGLYCSQIITLLHSFVMKMNWINISSDKWHSIDPKLRSVIDICLDFLAIVGSEQPVLLDIWHPRLLPLLRAFFPLSVGSVKIVLALLRHCSAKIIDGELMQFLQESFDDIPPLLSEKMTQLICHAQLANHDPVVSARGCQWIIHELNYSLKRSLMTLIVALGESSEDVDNDKVNSGLLDFINMMVLFVKNPSFDGDEAIMTVIRDFFDEEFVKTEVFENEDVTLDVKIEMIHLLVRIYPADEVDIDEFVLTELRSFRLMMPFAVDSHDHEAFTVIKSFLFKAVLPLTIMRIFATKIIQPSNVEQYLLTFLQDMTGKMASLSFENAVHLRLQSSLLITMQSMDKDMPHVVASPYLPSEIPAVFMLTLNLISAHNASIFDLCSTQEKWQLLIIIASLHLFLTTRKEMIFDRVKNAPVQPDDYISVVKRLGELLLLFLDDRLHEEAQTYAKTAYKHELEAAVLARLRTSYHSSSSLNNSYFPAGLITQTSRSGNREEEHFNQNLDIECIYPAVFLRNCYLFEFMQQTMITSSRFFDLGGESLVIQDKGAVPSQLKSSAFISKFSQYSVIDLWLQSNAKFIRIILQYLEGVTIPSATDYVLMQVITLLADENIDQIRSSPYLSLAQKTTRIDIEKTRLDTVQKVLSTLGGQETVIKIIGRSHASNVDEIMLQYSPLAMKLGQAIVTYQNKPLQASFINAILRGIDSKKPPETHFLLGYQMLIRRLTSDILSFTHHSTATTNKQQITALRACLQVFNLAGSVCSGENTSAQKLMAGIIHGVQTSVNIAKELSNLTHALLTRLKETLVYIKNEQFYEKLAAPVYSPKDSSKRRFLAWNHPNNNIILIAQYVHVISIAFENLTNLCQEESIDELLLAMPRVPALLEFLGLMQLSTEVKLPVVSALTPGRTLNWYGNDPVHFYVNFLKETKAAGILTDTDPEYVAAHRILENWTQTLGSSAFTFAASKGLSSSATSIQWSRNRDFKKLFGISFKLFMRGIRKAEYNCLRFLLTSFDFCSDVQATRLARIFDDGILIQNMDNLFRKLGRVNNSQRRDETASSTVAYISLIEAIGLRIKETDDLLAGWDADYNSRGIKPKSIYGSVELIGPDKRLRRLYFPVPTFVTTFWSYPEVMKSKDMIVLEVDRSSVETKIIDFLSQLSKIYVVMKRQEVLKLILTYPVHGIFGGKTVSVFQRYLPKQRFFGLLLTVGLNGYFVYYHTKPFYLSERANYASSKEWGTTDIVVYTVQWVQFAIYASFALRTVINSTAADTMPDMFKIPLMKYIVGAVLVCLDSSWALFLTAMAFFAIRTTYWLYVPCLLDVLFQVPAVNFLYLAISRNIFRVLSTIGLAFLCLYFYSIIAYLFFADQYTLNGYHGCQGSAGACFLLHIDYGLQNVPAWENRGYIQPELGLTVPYARQISYVLGSFFNISYVILINLVLQALISGLIIDSFQAMRDENEAKLADIADKCFVCSIGRDDFEQAGVDYITHITEEHSMWHVLWFMIYLDLKDPLSLSSAENHAKKSFQDRGAFLKMMPIGRSLTIETKRAEAAGNQAQEDEQLEMDKMGAMLMKMSEVAAAQGKLAVMVRNLAMKMQHDTDTREKAAIKAEADSKKKKGKEKGKARNDFDSEDDEAGASFVVRGDDVGGGRPRHGRGHDE